jgi:hypothetical protein
MGEDAMTLKQIIEVLTMSAVIVCLVVGFLEYRGRIAIGAKPSKQWMMRALLVRPVTLGSIVHD